LRVGALSILETSTNDVPVRIPEDDIVFLHKVGQLTTSIVVVVVRDVFAKPSAYSISGRSKKKHELLACFRYFQFLIYVAQRTVDSRPLGRNELGAASGRLGSFLPLTAVHAKVRSGA
jgi:hypothetical protein